MTSLSNQQANNARLRKEMLNQRQAAESSRASAYLHQFVAAAKRGGLEPEPLLVRGYGGRGSAKTPLFGWYLKNDHSVGVDTEGNFYLLIEQLSLLDRLRGITPKQSAPTLVLGAGGRDGESIDLTAKLSELLPGWNENRGDYAG